MKTISRYTTTGLLMAAFLALGAVAGIAQDPTPTGSTAGSEPEVCKDPALTSGSEKITADFTAYRTLSTADKRKALENAEAFSKKYTGCESAKAFVDYINQNLPNLKTGLAKIELAEKEKGLTTRFNAAVKGKNFDEVYAAGRELLALDPEKWRAVTLPMGLIGYDESLKSPSVTKYNDDSMKYAKQALADLQGGKTFSTFNLGGSFDLKNKDNAIGWMKASIGYLTYLKNPKDGLASIYEATQSPLSDASKEIALYGAIADHYYNELRNLTKEIETMRKGQLDTDPPEVAKQKVDAIDAKAALAFGYAERAMDAYARSHKVASSPAAKAAILKRFTEVYDFRFAKTEGIEPWMAAAVAKPFVNPTTPVEPVKVADPAAAPATTGSTAPPAATAPSTTTTKAPATTPVKSTTTPTTTAKPANLAKPQAKKVVAKRKRA